MKSPMTVNEHAAAYFNGLSRDVRFNAVAPALTITDLTKGIEDDAAALAVAHQPGSAWPSRSAGRGSTILAKW